MVNPLFLDLILRNESPISIKIVALGLLLVIFALYAVNPSWIVTNWVLASLPIQRFKWKSEPLLSSSFNRFSSAAISVLVLGAFFHSRLDLASIMLFDQAILAQLWLYLAIIFVVKLGLNTLFFGLHESMEIGRRLIDFQYAFNLFGAFLLTLWMCVDVFYLRLAYPFFIHVSIALLVLFLVRISGSILLLLNNFDFPLIALFIYLCAFEITPVLLLAKVIFEIS